jgi:protoporphyrinogen oxidase
VDSPVVVVGAGLAGLCCARRLHRRDVPVLVIERDSRIGGRLKTDTFADFRLDHGMQVYFEAYPAGQKELDYGRLDFRAFPPGATIRHCGEFHTVDRSNPIGAAFDALLSARDKMLVVELTRDCLGMTEGQIWQTPDKTAQLALRQNGFSPEFLENFVRPFFGTIFLDRSLSISWRMFLFVWKMLAEGRTVVPAKGIGAIPVQLALDLPEDSIRLNCTAVSVAGDSVTLESGEQISARSVVVATEALEAASLTGLPTVGGSVGETCLYFETPQPPNESGHIILTSEPGLVQMVTPVSEVVPESAPPGRNLVSVTILGQDSRCDDELSSVVLEELGGWLPVEAWNLLKVFRLPYCQFVEPPGFNTQLPSNTPGRNGVYFAGEFTRNSSINGALESGAECAQLILEDLGVIARISA